MVIFYKGEDIIIHFNSDTDISTYTKVVKFFTPFSAIKTATVNEIDDNNFTATISDTQSSDLKTGTLNIVVEFSLGGNTIISKSVQCQLNDAYQNGGARESTGNSEFSLNFNETTLQVSFETANYGSILEVTEARDEAVQAKEDAQAILETIDNLESIGILNATTAVATIESGTVTLTGTPPTGWISGQSVTVQTVGNISFAGVNFMSGTTLQIGDELRKRDTQWELLRFSVGDSTITPEKTTFANAIFSNRNILKNSNMLFFSDSTNPLKTNNQTGTSTFVIEDSAFARKQLRITSPAGARGQLRTGITIESGKKYSGGFFYKIITGTLKPILSDFSFLTGSKLTTGTLREVELADGWVYRCMENAVCSSNYSDANNGYLIDFNNTGGSTTCEVLIASPQMVCGSQIPEMVLEGSEFAFNYIAQQLINLNSASTNRLYSNRNILKNSNMLFFSDATNPLKTNAQTGTPTFSVEDSAFARKQLRIVAKVGDRGQLKTGFTIELGKSYSAGFFYKIISGNKTPYLYSLNNQSSNALTDGVLREVSLADGWVFHCREGAVCSTNYSNSTTGFLIDFNNVGGSTQCEVLIASPQMVCGSQIPEMLLEGSEFAFNYIATKFTSLDANIASVKNADWNLLTDSGLFCVNLLGNIGIRTNNQTGISTFTSEKNIFGGKQQRINVPVGARGQLITQLTVEANTSYSYGFFYKVIAGTKLPVDSAFTISSVIPGNVSTGTVTITTLADGWVFYKRENFSYNQASTTVNGLYVDIDNRTGSSVASEILIAMPILIKNTKLDAQYPNGTFDAIINLFSRVASLESSISAVQTSDWNAKVVALYGDSITAINNGDYTAPITKVSTKWGTIVANYFNFSKLYARGAGGQKYAWGNAGGSVVFVNSTTGQYNSRDDGFNFDNYTGAIPSGCVKTRGAFSSWDRITKMFPAGIKDTIHAVIIKGATNDAIDATDVSFVANSTVDTEWASSTYYATYGGDYNINTLKGGIASTVMKMQAWMPQAVIIIATPLSGRGTTGQIQSTLTTDETTKAIYVRDIARLMSIPIIDVNANVGINSLNRNAFITDSLHPYNADGNMMLSRAVIQDLKTIMPKI